MSDFWRMTPSELSVLTYYKIINSPEYEAYRKQDDVFNVLDANEDYFI